MKIKAGTLTILGFGPACYFNRCNGSHAESAASMEYRLKPDMSPFIFV
jgi:hypothetical protein